MKDLSIEILSDLTVYMKYARFINEKTRRESWIEIAYRNRDMHIRRYPHLENEIINVYNEFVIPKKVLPSMRSMQFGGRACEINPARIYNCSYLPIDDLHSFSETMFLLLSGTGVGYSVQKHHIEKLPEIKKPNPKSLKRFLVNDSIEGWADSIKMLIKSYFKGGSTIHFDYSDIREKGSSLITSGGKAPGAQPLKDCVEMMTKMLNRKSDGDKLTSIEVHDLICTIADAVLVGGIRRAALICLFSKDDNEMLNCKSSSIKVDEMISSEYALIPSEVGFVEDENRMLLTFKQNGILYENIEIHKKSYGGGEPRFHDLDQFNNNGTFGWWVANQQRARANNSVVLERSSTSREEFDFIWKKTKDSYSGEPGFYWTSDIDAGTNPCKPLKSLILTDKGFITFKQAINKHGIGVDNSMKVFTPEKKIAKAKSPFKTGKKKEVFKISLSDGTNLYGTNNHIHRLFNGTEKRVDELNIGDLLENNIFNIHKDFSIKNNKEYELGLITGWLHADGCHTKRIDRTSNSDYTFRFYFGVGEFDVIPIFEKILGNKAIPHSNLPKTLKVINISTEKFKNKILDTGYNLADKNDLTWIYGKSKDFKIGFLKSVFSADGSISKDISRLHSNRKEALEVIVNILKEFGLYSCISIHNKANVRKLKDGTIRNNNISYKIEIRNYFFKNIGFLCKFKQDQILSKDWSISKRLENKLSKVSIKSIELDSIEDVYDITVNDNKHYFIDSGVSTHNCVEISLNPYQFCNLTEINASSIGEGFESHLENFYKDIHLTDDELAKIKKQYYQEDFNKRARAASFIGTLQAGYTNFHYLRKIWQRTTEKEALLGVSMTGIASNIVIDHNLCDLQEASQEVIKENKRVAELIGINSAARTTAVKPAGTTSLVLGTSSGIHSWHNDYYIRRMRVNKNEPIYSYLKNNIPELIEDDVEKPEKSAVISIPQHAPLNAITRSESVFNMLDRVKKVYTEWVSMGHISGKNTHNVSATVNIRYDKSYYVDAIGNRYDKADVGLVERDEWDLVNEWMWNNRELYAGLSVLPYDGGTYRQAPFEDCTKEVYEEMMTHLKQLNISAIKETEDTTNFISDAVACSSGNCELK